jgi:hypothetical protein
MLVCEGLCLTVCGGKKVLDGLVCFLEKKDGCRAVLRNSLMIKGASNRPARPVGGGILQKVSLRTCSLLLLSTASLKFATLAMSTRKILPDPLFPFLTDRQLLTVGAVLECLVGLWVWQNWISRSAAWMLQWICGLFITYRIGLKVVGYTGPCRCLGELADWMPGGGRVADQVSVGILFSIIVISGFNLLERGSQHLSAQEVS